MSNMTFSCVNPIQLGASPFNSSPQCKKNLYVIMSGEFTNFYGIKRHLATSAIFFHSVNKSWGQIWAKSPPKSPLLVERNHILIQTTQFILQCNALRAFAVSYLDNQYRSQYNPDSFALISVYAVMHLRIEDSRPIVRTLSPGGGHGTKAAHANPWSASSSFFIEIKTTNHCYTTTNTNTTATTTKKSRHIQHSTTTKTVPSSQCNNMQYHAARPSIFH